jgi:hypothetical protein
MLCFMSEKDNHKELEMEISSFVINMALKICPVDFLNTDSTCASFVELVPNFNNLNQLIYLNPIIADSALFSFMHQYNQYSVVSSPIINGWSVEFSNNSDVPFAFYLDINTKSIQLGNPCRMKIVYSSNLFDQISAQKNPNVLKQLHSWNSVKYDNYVAFDTLCPIKVQDSNSESIYIWNPIDANFSTQWFKHSMTIKVESNSSEFVRLYFFDLEDVNMDRKVDAEDLTIALNSWGTKEGDVDGNGITNAVDTGMILSKWRESSNR